MVLIDMARKFNPVLLEDQPIYLVFSPLLCIALIRSRKDTYLVIERFVHPGRPRGSNNWVEMSRAAHYWAQVHLPQSDLPEDPAKKSDLTRDMDLNKNVCGSLSLLEDRAHKPQCYASSKL